MALTSAATTAQAQSDTGGALLAYKEGVTPEKEKTDRAACHEWAVEQTGFDPTAIYQAQMAGVKTRTILKVTEKLDAASGFTDPRWGGGGFAGARGSADVRRLNALYEEYLAAGALCLEGRGYTVMSKGGE
ncbi:hypothetical protein V6C03_02305 [Methyloligella sp. 2.7D]|uniref:hypothetical protein n=1 Tax=unclassified Methyloligella TaxID=2625955 RepID=UPI00157D9084|nr:hypothetical protein [Methyloligella sp. GL2]QKP76538.1 hypothetical protein HT051_03115 [Methyloligella sp. GL2]